MYSVKQQKAICLGYYVVLGMLGTGMLPGLIKSFEDTLSITHATMGQVLGLSIVLFTTCAIASGIVYDRFGVRTIMSLAMAAIAFSALLMWRVSAFRSFLAAFLLFQGSNALATPVNPFVGELYGDERSRGISLLHGFQGVGRTLAPLAIAGCIFFTGRWQNIFLVAAAAHLMLFYMFLHIKPRAPSAKAPAKESGRLRRAWHLLADPVLLLGLVGFVFLAASEGTFFLWFPNYLESEVGFPKTEALKVFSLFVLGYTACRIALGMKKGGAGLRTITASVILLGASFLVAATFPSKVLVSLAAFSAGVAIGPFWPVMMAALFDYAPRGHGVITGLCILSSSIGGIVASTGAGWVGDAVSLRFALLISPALAAAYAIVFSIFTLLSRRRPVREAKKAMRSVVPER
jgi:fucose permease